MLAAIAIAPIACSAVRRVRRFTLASGRVRWLCGQACLVCTARSRVSGLPAAPAGGAGLPGAAQRSGVG
jgi:hypothetical protein